MIVKRSLLATLLTVGVVVAVQAHSPGVPHDPDRLAKYRAGLAAYQQQDYAAALEQWRPIAEAGSPAAQLYLGFINVNGLGVARDSAAAAEWYRRAAEQDNMLAQLRLSMLYRQGQGLGRDPVQAHLWAGLAARDHKHLENVAKALQEALEADMTPAQLAEARRLARDWLAKLGKGH